MKFVVLFGLLIGAQATAAEIRCDNCSEATYQSQAQSRGIGTHYVYDLVKGQVRKYELERSCEEGNVCYTETTALPVEDDVVKAVLELTAYREVTQGTMKSRFEFTTTGSSIQDLSAFDVAAPGGPRTRLINWILSDDVKIRNALPVFNAQSHSIISTVINIFKNNVGKTTIEIQFSDGSKITVAFEPINSTVTVEEGSAIDKYGNVIPTSVDQINSLRFDYSREGPNGPAQERMRNYLSFYGVKVTTNTRWSCVKVGDSAWHCSPY